MRRPIALLLFAVIASFAPHVIANDKPTAEFQTLMKSNGMTVAALRMHIMAKEYEGIAMDAATLRDNFDKIEAFWRTRNVADAVEFARAGAKGAADLETAAKAKSDDGIAAANKATTGACAGCHMAHREQLPDKTFEIK
jgi:cytochrome c556